MSTDRELLELAAKAADYVIRWYEDSLTYGPTFGIEVEPGNPCGFDPWNPLTDDGDALRLAYKLSIGLAFNVIDGSSMAYREKQYGYVSCHEPPGNDGMAETRRAIVRAAAEIGRSMP